MRELLEGMEDCNGILLSIYLPSGQNYDTSSREKYMAAIPSCPSWVWAVGGTTGCDRGVLQPLTSHDLKDMEVGGGAGKTETGSARDNNLGIAASAESNVCELTYNGPILARSYDPYFWYHKVCDTVKIFSL